MPYQLYLRRGHEQICFGPACAKLRPQEVAALPIECGMVRPPKRPSGASRITGPHCAAVVSKIVVERIIARQRGGTIEPRRPKVFADPLLGCHLE